MSSQRPAALARRLCRRAVSATKTIFDCILEFLLQTLILQFWSPFDEAIERYVQQEAFVTASGEKRKSVSGLGHNKLYSSSSDPGQSVSRRWLHSLGLLRPRAADYTITRSVLDKYGTSRQGIHEIARRAGSVSARRALLQNARGRRGFCSENGKKKVIGHEAFGVLMISIPRALRVTAFRVRLSSGGGSDRDVLVLEFNLVQEDRFTGAGCRGNSEACGHHHGWEL